MVAELGSRSTFINNQRRKQQGNTHDAKKDDADIDDHSRGGSYFFPPPPRFLSPPATSAECACRPAIPGVSRERGRKKGQRQHPSSVWMRHSSLHRQRRLLCWHEMHFTRTLTCSIVLWGMKEECCLCCARFFFFFSHDFVRRVGKPLRRNQESNVNNVSGRKEGGSHESCQHT